jgi:glycosyltransferase involved in cell wall biosynthesis
MPTLTVITPCYNAARYIGATIESVRLQSYADWEHIVIDDGSADGSARVIEQHAAREPRLRLVRQSNAGCAKTRNRGLRYASVDSRHLLFLDADDVLEPDALAHMISYLESHRDVGLAYCDFTIIDGNDHTIHQSPYDNGWGPRLAPSRYGVRQLPIDEPDTPLESILAVTAIIPSVCFLRRSIFEQTPGWDEEMGVIYEDVGLYMHVALRSKVHLVPKKLVRYRRHATQSSTHEQGFGTNLAKFYAKWCSGGAVPGLTPEQQARLDAACWFREHRLMPRIGWRAGLRFVRAGQLGLAAKYWTGAARRYITSFRVASW